MNYWTNIIWGFFLVLSIAGCKESKKPETAEEVAKRHEIAVETHLRQSAEKIILIAGLMHISYDTVHSVLLEYSIKSKNYLNSEDSVRANLNAVINNISVKYALSIRRISRILFAWKYEMITRDEIEDEILENLEDDAADRNDDDPDN